MIIKQERDLSTYDTNHNKRTKQRLKNEKEEQLKQEAQDILEVLPDVQRSAFQSAQEKGASSWLAALPIQKLGYYALNKQRVIYFSL